MKNLTLSLTHPNLSGSLSLNLGGLLAELAKAILPLIIQALPIFLPLILGEQSPAPAPVPTPPSASPPQSGN